MPPGFSPFSPQNALYRPIQQSPSHLRQCIKKYIKPAEKPDFPSEFSSYNKFFKPFRFEINNNKTFCAIL